MDRRCQLLALSLVLCAGCGGGSGSADGKGSSRSPLSPKQGPLSHDEVQHFLIRTQFGANKEEVADLQNLGLATYLDRMLTFDPDDPIETAAEREIEELGYPTGEELVRWWLYLMTRTATPFREMTAFFWHDHFATSQVVFDRAGMHLMREHIQLLRKKGFGNLRDLVYSVATDPAMLIWLDGVSSTKENPNENFAREFWELFTLGVDNGYTQDDIEQAARAFTGYRARYDSQAKQRFVTWDPVRHDAGAKEVFGQSGFYGYPEIVDLTFEQRPVAEFVSKKIYEWFCHANPPADLVAEMASILRDNDYEIAPLLRVLLQSEAFFSAQARQPQIKAPLEYAVGFIRTTGLELDLEELDSTLFSLRQRPSEPPDVDGWPTGAAWLSSQSMLQRGNLVNEVVTARDHHSETGGSLHVLLPPRRTRSAEHVVDELAQLLRVRPSESERQRYVQYLNTEASLSSNKLQTKDSPFDWTDPRHIDERVRGLLFILAQHPTYHIR